MQDWLKKNAKELSAGRAGDDHAPAAMPYIGSSRLWHARP